MNMKMMTLSLLSIGLMSQSFLVAHADYRYDYDHHRPLVSPKTGKIIKGGLVGAGIGAGSALLLNKNVGKTALLGAGIGAGTQAVRYSQYLKEHPYLKTGAYGALAGAGVSGLTREGSLGKGALVGAGAGVAIQALKDHLH